jgi:hypothetical protein
MLVPESAAITRSAEHFGNYNANGVVAVFLVLRFGRLTLRVGGPVEDHKAADDEFADLQAFELGIEHAQAPNRQDPNGRHARGKREKSDGSDCECPSRRRAACRCARGNRIDRGRRETVWGALVRRIRA